MTFVARNRHKVLTLALVTVLSLSYLSILLSNSQKARSQAQAWSEQTYRVDVERTSRALQYFLMEREHNLKTISQSPEVQSFYSSRALGMSMRYGLMANLIQLRKRLAKTVYGFRLSDVPTFAYIGIIEPDGQILADTLSPVSGRRIPDNYTPLLSEQSNKATRWNIVDDNEMLVGTRIMYKDEYVATLVAKINPLALYRNILSSGTEPTRADIIQQHAGVSVHAAEVPPHWIETLHSQILNNGSLVHIPQSSKAPETHLIAYSIPVPQTPFSLVSVDTYDHVYRMHSTGLSLLLAAVLPIAIVVLLLGFFKHQTLIQRSAEITASNLNLESLIAERTQELEMKSAEAQQANELKSEFLANMSHELRTPMHAILSYADLGKKRLHKAPKEKLKSYFDKIDVSGKRLLTLLNDLLDVAKLESGRVECKLEPTELREVLQNAIDEYDTLLQPRGITIVQNYPSNIFINIDRLKFGQVVRNLLSNAIKFTRENGRIWLTAHRIDSDAEASAIRFIVEDEGVGIPFGELEDVFDKFIQSSRTHTHAGGTGLGLAISRELVELHQGRIWAEHGDHGGARFVVELPTIENQSTPCATKQTDEPALRLQA